MSNEFTIDRFEENYAICELNTGKTINVSREFIPSDAKEGDIIKTTILEEKSNIRKLKIKNKFNSLKKD